MRCILFIRTAGIFAAVSTLSFSLPVPNAAAARKIPPTTLSVQYGKVLERGVQKIELTAVYENKGLYATQATISVSDTKTDELLFRFSPERDAGYSPAIALADFTGDGTEEIFFGADSGGSGGFGFYYLFSVMSGDVQILFDFETYPENFRRRTRTDIKCRYPDETPRDNISSIFRGGTRTTSPPCTTKTGFSASRCGGRTAVNTVLPFFVNYGNRYNLLVMRRITGLYNADSFGYTQEFLRFDGKTFIPYFTAIAVI